MQQNGVLFGGVPERSKGSDCKSDGSAFEGSNPSPSTKNNEIGRAAAGWFIRMSSSYRYREIQAVMRVKPGFRRV